MDRTKNLLDSLSGCSHPADDAALLLGAKTLANPPSRETAEESETAQEDSSLELLVQINAQQPDSNRDWMATAGNNSDSSFAMDPYVAQPIAPNGEQDNHPKSINEILKNLHGYQDRLERNEEPNDSHDQPSADFGETTLNAMNSSDGSANQIGRDKSGKNEMNTENQTKPERQASDSLKDANKKTEAVASIRQKSPPATTVEIIPVDYRATKSLEELENFLAESIGDIDQPEYDMHFFGEPTDCLIGTPDPIRNAFEFDPDYFDHAPAEIRRDRRINSDPTVVLGPQFRRSSDGASSSSPSHSPESTESGETTTENDTCFWVKDGELISIDGNDGFRCIDLACFDISAASFQASKIEIRCEDGLTFQIEYSNVSHALFANAVEVELATRTFVSPLR